MYLKFLIYQRDTGTHTNSMKKVGLIQYENWGLKIW